MPEGKPDYNNRKKKLPIKLQPIATSFCKVGDEILADCTFEEEQSAVARLTIISNENGTINGAQKALKGSFTLEDIELMSKLAIKKAKELRSALKKAK